MIIYATSFPVSKTYLSTLTCNKYVTNYASLNSRDRGNNRLTEISRGRSRNDTIQDLHDLAYKGKSDPDSFNGFNYDLTLFDRAEELSSELMYLQALVHKEAGTGSHDKVFRDKAYTYLKELVDYIRKYGRFALRNQPHRLKLYQGIYFSRK